MGRGRQRGRGCRLISDETIIDHDDNELEAVGLGDCKRYGQIRRLFTLAELMRKYRFGLTLEAINFKLGDEYGYRCHVRTTRRDLALFNTLGWAFPCREYRLGLAVVVWKWSADRPIFEQQAESVKRFGYVRATQRFLSLEG